MASSIDPRAPVFISYRTSDGTELAVKLAWALRSAGVPVWHDLTDLPPGTTNSRLAEAFDAGLSGGVLVVTPEIASSTVIRDVELPLLLDLAARTEFTLSVGSTIYRQDGSGELDLEAPDRLLRRPSHDLSKLTQQRISTAEERSRVAYWQARRRITALRPMIQAAGGQLTLDVQSRVQPSAELVDADLVLRLRPPLLGHRAPDVRCLRDLQGFLANLPGLLELGGVRQLLVRNGAHLSIAYALGATVPTTLIDAVHVAQGGSVWTSGPPRRVDSQQPLLTGRVEELTAGADAVLVFVDLVPGRKSRPFEDLRASAVGRFAASLHLTAVVEDFLRPSDADRLVQEIDGAVRRLAGRVGTHDVHLLLRCPFALAVLLGRRANTLKVQLYELEDDGSAGESQRYVPVMKIRSGAGGSPIDHIIGAPVD